MLIKGIAKKRLNTLQQQAQNKVAFKPLFRGAALTLQNTSSFETIISGPAETGKTFAALYFLDRFLRTNANTVGLMVRDTLTSVYKTVLRSYVKLIRIYGDVKPYGGSKPEWYDYPNGSRLYIGGLDKPENVLSGEFDIIYINQAEGISLEAYETLITRATGRSHNADTTYVIGDCNPANAQHWILQRKSISLLHSVHRDNPTLYNDDGTLTPQGIKTIGILSGLTGIRLKRLYQGLWSNAEGLIYQYDPSKHLVDRFKIPKHWFRFCVIDFGYVNPFVCLWCAVDPDKRLYVYRELYQSNTLVSDLADTIKHYSEGEDIAVYLADHDAEDRATLERKGIITEPANKTIRLGIEAVQQRFKERTDNTYGFYYMRDSLIEIDPILEELHKPTSLLDEIVAYEWSKNKDLPNPHNDHAMDALRYAVAFIDDIGTELEDNFTTVIYHNPVTISPY